MRGEASLLDGFGYTWVKRCLGPIPIVFLSASLVAGQMYEENLPADHEAIRYWETAPEDPVTRLADDLAHETKSLEFVDGGPGYLPSLLELLGVSPDSQTLVFSKTSLQKQTISPRSPRAIYFADDVAVAYVPDGEMLEIASVDPRQGVVLYTLANRKTRRPRFVRPKICLACHQAPATLGVPGVYVGSVFTTPSGRPSYQGSIVSDHRTPFAERWGGWYVSTGDTSFAGHRGNAVYTDPSMDGLSSLARPPDAGASDVVALMTLEHQTQMTNLLIRLGWEARIDSGGSNIDSRIEEVVRYMIFADEAPLPAPVDGASSFRETFEARGLRDAEGRSLRDFDLQSRLFRYRLSYMAYSESFDALPAAVRERVYARLFEELTAPEAGSDRHAAAEILRRTEPTVPSRWRTDVR